MATFYKKIHDFCDWAWANPGKDVYDMFGDQPWYGLLFGYTVIGGITLLTGAVFVVSLLMFRETYRNIGYDPIRASQCWAVGFFLFLVSWLAFTYSLNTLLINFFGIAWKGIYFIHYAIP